MNKKGITTAAILGAIAGILTMLLVLVPKLQVAPDSTSLGSVTVGNEYQATSTSAIYQGSSSRLIRTGAGTLGSVVVTEVGTSGDRIEFFNATTSNASLRAASMASSTILLASYPATLAVGTYTFDVEYSIGLFVDVPVTGVGTSTITYR